jgi:hypothetical protein
MALKPNQLQVTTINQQANAIIERVHKSLNDMLRSYKLQNFHESTAWPIRSTYHTTLHATPCQLVFG